MKLLVISADVGAMSLLASRLSGVQLTVAPTLSIGLGLLRQGSWSAVLLDAEAADGAAMELLERLSSQSRRVILLARAISMGLTVEALKRGASDVLPFPPSAAELHESLARWSGSRHASRQTQLVATPPKTLIGSSPAMLSAFKTAARVATSNATVLLQGETGTGKELMAHLLHRHGARPTGPFVTVNCAAIPEHLLESELFGHEKGAFTGAVARRIGRFERASGGTLFLDEIGDMSVALQAKILRALQEREIERVGGESPIAVDVRVIAASNLDLAAHVADGRFREDLYYRLAVVVITLPPLRERGDDTRALAEHFMAHFAAEHGRAVWSIAPQTLACLVEYPWPGNVRQLRNVLERAVLLADGPVLLPCHLSRELWEAEPPQVGSREEGEGPLLPLYELERRHIRRTLAMTSGHLARAAEVLGIHRNTLRRKLQEIGWTDDAPPDQTLPPLSEPRARTLSAVAPPPPSSDIAAAAAERPCIPFPVTHEVALRPARQASL